MPLLTKGARDGRQMWQGESGRNTQFGTNCGRLPAAFLAAKRSAICCRTDPSYLCIGNFIGSADAVKRKIPMHHAQGFLQAMTRNIGHEQLFSLESSSERFRNSFSRGWISREVRRARKPAALFPFCTCKAASFRKDCILVSSSSVNSFIKVSI